MQNFKVTTPIDDSRCDNQFFDDRAAAEAAAVELARSGFFSTLWQRGQVNPVSNDAWRYLCEYVGAEVAA